MADSFNGNTELGENENNFRGSQTFGRENFKTFTLLRQQDDFISKFETNLQKTLELISDNPSKDSNPKEQHERRAGSPLLQHENETSKDLDDNKNVEKPPLSIKELRSSSTKDLLNELRGKKETSDHNCGSSQDKTNSLNRRINELNAENEQLKSDMIKVKTDSLKKYEQLKKNNDELLLSYEERSKITIKNLKEQHEAEITELREEIEYLKSENDKGKEAMRKQKERMGLTIMELEKEKHELLSKMGRLQFKNIDSQSISSQQETQGERHSVSSNASNAHASSFLLDQLLREKNETEKRYNDLFSSYSVLLEHNKALSEKFQTTEKEEHGRKKSKTKAGKLSTEPDQTKSAKPKSEINDLNSSMKKIESSATKSKPKKEKDYASHNPSFSAQKEEDKLSSSYRRDSYRQNTSKNSTCLKPKEPTLELEDLKSFDDSSFQDKAGESNYTDPGFMLSTKANQNKSSSIGTEKKKNVRSSSNLERAGLNDKENMSHSQLNSNIKSKPRKTQQSEDKKEGTPLISKKKAPLKEKPTNSGLTNSARKAPKGGASDLKNPIQAKENLKKDNILRKSQNIENKENNTHSKSTHNLNSSKKIPLYSKVTK